MKTSPSRTKRIVSTSSRAERPPTARDRTEKDNPAKTFRSDRLLLRRPDYRARERRAPTEKECVYPNRASSLTRRRVRGPNSIGAWKLPAALALASLMVG